MTEFLNDDQYIVDVSNVHGVQIGICMEQFGGCTPGYWKQDQHFDSWITYSPEQFFDEVFGVGPHVTLLDAMWTGGGGQNVILRHAPAALMNTQDDNVNYEFTADEVIQMVQDAFANETFEELEAILVGANEQICPLN